MNLLAAYLDIPDPLSLFRNRHTAISDYHFPTNQRMQPTSASAFPAWLLPGPLLILGDNKIAFTSNRDGSAQIYLMNADGTAQARLTNNEANDEFPKWSPDNTHLLFQSDRDHPFSGSAEIYVMNADGTAQTRLTNNTEDDSCPVWSPDGNRVAFQSIRNDLYYQVYVMNSDGSNQVNISNSNTNDGQPSWSPDGTKIAFTSERDHPGTPSIYVMNADGSNQTRLTFSAAGIRDEQPAWSPDGTKLLFTSTRDSVVESWQETGEEGGIVNRTAVHTNKEVYLMNADGSNQVKLTNSLENDDSPAWSNDGTKIVFRSERERDGCDPVQQVWVMNTDGSSQVDLSNNWLGDYCPNWQGLTGNTSSNESSDTTGANATASPVTINFDNLPIGTIITNQYPGVIFSGVGFSGGVGTNSYDYNIRISNGRYRSYPNSIISVTNSGADSGWVYADFPIPVNNLSFYALNIIDNTFAAGYVAIYQNKNYYGTYYFTGDGNPNNPRLIDLSSIPNITGIFIYNYRSYPIYYDDFSFTSNLNVNITSGRVSGHINGTTQNALLGADVALQANIEPSNLTGGTYSWSVTGPNQQVSATNANSSYTVRWTEPGTYQATVTYTRNGVPVSATVNVNITVPTLDSYTGNQEPSFVSGYGPPCSIDLGTTSLGSNIQYTLGCVDLGSPGITFSSTVHIPTGSYLSDPNQSGVKYVQRVSAFRKQLNGGVVKCRTRRGSEGDSNSGWLFDGATADTYDPRPTAVRRFSEGSTLTIVTEDSPGEALEGPKIQGVPPTPPGLNDTHQHDAFRIDDNFELFVVYFTSTSSPLQRTVGKMSWNWGGEVIYDARVNTSYPFRRTIMFGGTGPKAGVPSNESITYYGRTDDPSFLMDTCPGASVITPNLIDNARFFVRQQYSDILNRLPDGAWRVWLSFITECGFDQACINRVRISVVRGFYESTEFRQSHPGFENPGSPEYNENYVRQLYLTLLRRPPDALWTGWLDYINQTGNYDGLVGGFVNSTEYRSRQWMPN
jgi:Tol biopolymer transport system component